MFSRILIANRGEIALRILRACRELGIETVCVYSEADKDAQYLRLANETVCIGPGASAKSYLDIARIISAAEITDVDAIHPGYGFLSENAHFAEICDSCRIGFIGPSAKTVALLGNKSKALEIARGAGVPVIPGSGGVVADEKVALEFAHSVGYPVMLKAAAGGGGRGMRLAHNDISLVNGFHAAQAEAEAAFKDRTLYLEKYVERARHIEFQILGDKAGNIIHLGERDCSVQRRRQKLIEESPSPILGTELRKRMGAAAIAIAKASGYYGAGTIEFLLDADHKFYFIEANARVQVEHPVTEMVTGIDIIKEQIRVAAGEPLAMTQDEVILRGAAIECRINAEDPYDGFRPRPGKITAFTPPGGPNVRLDTHAHAGYTVPQYYDSMIGKLICHGADRNAAILTMRRALEEFVIEGVPTTIPFFLDVLKHIEFIEGQVDTQFIETHFVKA